MIAVDRCVWVKSHKATNTWYVLRDWMHGGQGIESTFDNIDDAIARAKELFGAEHVNVQPYSGSPANFAAYLAVADPGDTIMGLDLPHGGHLTHGWKVNFTGKLFQAVHYKLDRETERLDYDAIRALAQEHKPKILIAGHSAYPRVLDFEAFAEAAEKAAAEEPAAEVISLNSRRKS